MVTYFAAQYQAYMIPFYGWLVAQSATLCLGRVGQSYALLSPYGSNSTAFCRFIPAQPVLCPLISPDLYALFGIPPLTLAPCVH